MKRLSFLFFILFSCSSAVTEDKLIIQATENIQCQKKVVLIKNELINFNGKGTFIVSCEGKTYKCNKGIQVSCSTI